MVIFELVNIEADQSCIFLALHFIVAGITRFAAFKWSSFKRSYELSMKVIFALE